MYGLSGKEAVMSIEDEARDRTKHIADPVERERKYNIFIKVLGNLAAADAVEEGRVPFRQPRDQNRIKSITPKEYDQRENARINELVSQNILADEPEIPVEPPQGSDINARGKFGYTRLHQAVVDGNIEEVRRLKYELGIDLTVCDNSGQTAYEKALAAGETDIADELKPTEAVAVEETSSLIEDDAESMTEDELEKFMNGE
jgi:hypothetical protein